MQFRASSLVVLTALVLVALVLVGLYLKIRQVSRRDSGL